MIPFTYFILTIKLPYLYNWSGGEGSGGEVKLIKLYKNKANME